MGAERTVGQVPERLGRVGVFSPGIRRIPHLRAFLGADRIVFRPDLWRRPVDVVVGWGRKPNTEPARRHAEGRNVPFIALEDGFVRSMDLGVSGEPPLSMVLDDCGIYYDATSPSRLERILAGPGEDRADPLDDPGLLERARRCMDSIRRHRISKYNAAPVLDLGSKRRERILVVDQTWGDMSVKLGKPSAEGFEGMVSSALREHPDAEIVIKTHPDVLAGRKRGHVMNGTGRDRVRLIAEPANPIGLIEQVDAVRVMTSLMGLEALIVGKPVTCFGAPFYSGWGLTDDRVPVSRRGRRRTLEQVFAASHLLYSRYVDPETGQRCELEGLLQDMALQRQMAEANAGTLVCVGFSAWKRGFIPAFLQSPRGRTRFAKDAGAAARLTLERDSKLVVWASREDEAVRALARERDLPLWRMEDGFLRSVGLGSDLYAPASLVVDRLGIYYDPARPSELEEILQEGTFDPEELDRAAGLRRAIVESGISKYNVGSETRVAVPDGDGRRVVLVVGQVEDDASIRLGCPGIRRNADLLRAVREMRPDAHLIFKPHPDVVSGNRDGGVERSRALDLADQVIEDAPLAACLGVSDEIHTLTSLVGFEALLRGLTVVVHGQPFYSGWGLTDDRHPHPRRSRSLSLDELVAGALIRYPRYVSRRTGRFTTPERIVEQLRRDRARQRGFRAIGASWPARQARKMANLVRGVIRVS